MDSQPKDAAVAQALGGYFRDRAGSGVVSAYLFGSYAGGRSHRESDVDVGVLLMRDAFPTARDRFGERVRLAADLIGELNRNEVDVVILNDAPPLFARHIVTTGERVFCADDVSDRDFTRDCQLRAADLEPFLRRTRRVKLESLEP